MRNISVLDINTAFVNRLSSSSFVFPFLENVSWFQREMWKNRCRHARFSTAMFRCNFLKRVKTCLFVEIAAKRGHGNSRTTNRIIIINRIGLEISNV